MSLLYYVICRIERELLWQKPMVSERVVAFLIPPIFYDFLSQPSPIYFLSETVTLFFCSIYTYNSTAAKNSHRHFSSSPLTFLSFFMTSHNFTLFFFCLSLSFFTYHSFHLTLCFNYLTNQSVLSLPRPRSRSKSSFSTFKFPIHSEYV